MSATAILGLLLIAGCVHPCGYVDVHTRLIPLGDEWKVERLPAAQPLRLVRGVDAGSSVLEVEVEECEVETGAATLQTFGRRTYAPFRGYAPIVKPLAAVTMVLPLYLSALDPHRHDGGNWTFFDYTRDVISWFNPFSAIPTGKRRVETEPTLMRVRTVTAPLAERRVPIAGRTVALYLDDNMVAEQVSDTKGIVRFDLAEHLTRESAGTVQRLRLVTQRADGEEAILDLPLPEHVLKGLVGEPFAQEPEPDKQ